MDPHSDRHRRSQLSQHQIYPLLSQMTPPTLNNPHIPSIPPPQVIKPPGHPVQHSSHPTLNNIPHPAGKVQCTICFSYFNKSTDLQQHIETVHEGQKTHCTICSAHFSRKTDLKRHIETVHEGKKTQCPTCHSYFSKNTDLKRHIETVHEGKRTLCALCSASFSRKTDLKRHIEAVHEGKRTQCPQCATTFSRRTDLKRHIETVHEGKKTQCPLCSASFSRKTDLKRHVESVHAGKQKQKQSVQVASSNGNVYFNLNYSLNQWYINFINEILPISNPNLNFANLMPGKLKLIVTDKVSD